MEKAPRYRGLSGPYQLEGGEREGGRERGTSEPGWKVGKTEEESSAGALSARWESKARSQARGRQRGGEAGRLPDAMCPLERISAQRSSIGPFPQAPAMIAHSESGVEPLVGLATVRLAWTATVARREMAAARTADMIGSSVSVCLLGPQESSSGNSSRVPSALPPGALGHGSRVWACVRKRETIRRDGEDGSR